VSESRHVVLRGNPPCSRTSSPRFRILMAPRSTVFCEQRSSSATWRLTSREAAAPVARRSAIASSISLGSSSRWRSSTVSWLSPLTSK